MKEDVYKLALYNAMTYIQSQESSSDISIFTFSAVLGIAFDKPKEQTIADLADMGLKLKGEEGIDADKLAQNILTKNKADGEA